MNPAPEPTNSSEAGERILPRAFAVLKQHPMLAAFPAGSVLAIIGFFLLFATAFAPYRNTSLPWVMDTWRFLDIRENPGHLPAIAAFYLVANLVGTFCNVAFYHEIMKAYAGERPSFVRGINFAGARLIPILTWSLFAASIGLLLRALSERLGWVGKLFVGAVGFAWSVSSIFVIPVLVRDGTRDPMRLLQESGNLVKNTWGGLVYGLVRLWMLPVIIPLVCVLIIMPAIVIPIASGHGGNWANFALIGVFGVLMVYSTAIGMLQSLYYCALYIYATEGVVPGPFVREDMDAAWKIKGR